MTQGGAGRTVTTGSVARTTRKHRWLGTLRDVSHPAELPDSDERLLEIILPGGAPSGAAGLFAEGSWLRRVSGEGAVLFGGGCALLMEVAHPLVAAGVAEHSNYREDPFGRLGRTLAAMNAMAFGERAAALAAARSVARAHQRVRGELREPVGRFPAGTHYSGRDPDLVLWVWATLAETARAAYETFVAPLSAEALDVYFSEHAVLARLLGVPPERVPGSREAFRRTFEAIVDGGDLVVGDAGRDIARFILDPPPQVRALGGGRVRAISTALLPPPIREAYGLTWDAERQQRFEEFAGSIRQLRAGQGDPAGPPAVDANSGNR